MPALPSAPALRIPADAALGAGGPQEGDWVFWAVLLLPTLALLVGVSVRRVGRDELVLVVRRGRVARSGATGFVARVPGLERFVAVPTHRQVLPLVVRALTRDGVEIVALADLVLAVESVPDQTPYDDPATSAVRVAEEVVAEAIGGFAAVTLVSTLGDLEGVLPDAITRRLPPGYGRHRPGGHRDRGPADPAARALAAAARTAVTPPTCGGGAPVAARR